MDERLKELLAKGANEPGVPGLDLEAVHQRAARSRNTRRSGTALAFGAAAVVLVAVNLGGGGRPLAADPTFAVLDRPAASADDSLSRTLRHPGLNPERQLDPDSVRAQISVGDWQYGLATAGDGQFVCIVRADLAVRVGSSSCVRSATLVAGFVVWATGDSPGPHVVLALADEFSAVVVGGEQIAVEANAIVIRGPNIPASLTLVGPTREVRVDLPSPPPAGVAPRVESG